MSDIQTGMTPGRKIKAAMWLSLCVTLNAGALVYIGAPEPVVQQAMWIIGLGWMGVILGQSGIDALAKYAEGKKTP